VYIGIRVYYIKSKSISTFLCKKTKNEEENLYPKGQYFFAGALYFFSLPRLCFFFSQVINQKIPQFFILTIKTGTVELFCKMQDFRAGFSIGAR